MLTNCLLKAIADTDQPRVILMTDAPNFTIIAYNEAYEQVTNTFQRSVIGRNIWEAFDPRKCGGNGSGVVLAALNRALAMNNILSTEPFHYNIPSAVAGEWEESWWQLDIVPVMAERGNPQYLVITTHKLNDRICL